MKEDNIKDKIINVPVEDILPNRFQPRLAFDEKELNELSSSISKYGVIQPIVLRQIGDKYEIIAGERRYKATVLAGLKTIPAIINNTDDNTSAEIALLENLQRKDLSVIEEAQSFRKLMNKGFTQEEIATKLGISQSSIANKIRLLSLPKKIQDALLYNKISERHARSLLSLNNSEMQLDLLDRIINEKLTVKQTEDEISKLLNKNYEEDDIPAEIKRIINNEKIINEKNNNEEFKFIRKETEEQEKQLPNIVEIDDSEKEKFAEKIEENAVINPFQSNFQNNIKKIEEEIQNQNEDFYDQIIKNSEKNINFNFVDLGDDIEGSIKEFEKNEINKIKNDIKDFVYSIGNKRIINIKELNFPDKDQIIIEIKK